MKPNPYGVYVLLNKNPLDGVILDNPNISGVRSGSNWLTVQGSNSSTFDWFDINDVLNACGPKGKQVGFSMAMGLNTPDWVFSNGAYKLPVTEDGNLEGNPWEPLPWDPIYLSQVQTFINVMGALYDGHPGLRYIVMGGFQMKNELPFLKTDADIEAAEEIAKNGAAGYSLPVFNDVAPTKYRGVTVPFAGQTGFALIDAILTGSRAVMDMWRAAFPNTPCIITGSQSPIESDEGLAPSAKWAQWASSQERTYCTSIGPNMGIMYASRYAELPDFHTYPDTGHPPRTITSYPRGDQMIHPVGSFKGSYTGVDITYGDGVTSGTSLSSNEVAVDDPANSADIGDTIVGSAFAPLTTISAIVTSTQFTLSQAALSDGSGKVFTILKRKPPLGQPLGTWPQWKGIRDQTGSCLYKGDQWAEYYYPDATATDPLSAAQVKIANDTFTSLYGPGDTTPPTKLPQAIIIGGSAG